MNLFQFKHFQVVVDYAHNPHGFEALGRFLDKVPDTPRSASSPGWATAATRTP